MAKTANLAKAKETKNDEFYTQCAAVPQLTSLFNYYSTGDEVLSIYDTPDSDGSGKITIQPYVAPVRMHAYTIQPTLAAPDEQLRADPVFNHEPPEILSGNLQTGDIDILLARGVPALSGPAGAKQVGVNFNGTEHDLNAFANGGNWPRNGESDWNGWCHSDIKDVALPFVFQRFFIISQIQKGSQ